MRRGRRRRGRRRRRKRRRNKRRRRGQEEEGEEVEQLNTCFPFPYFSLIISPIGRVPCTRDQLIVQHPSTQISTNTQYAAWDSNRRPHCSGSSTPADQGGTQITLYAQSVSVCQLNTLLLSQRILVENIKNCLHIRGTFGCNFKNSATLKPKFHAVVSESSRYKHLQTSRVTTMRIRRSQNSVAININQSLYITILPVHFRHFPSSKDRWSQRQLRRSSTNTHDDTSLLLQLRTMITWIHEPPASD